jgi:hypothetical protein
MVMVVQKRERMAWSYMDLLKIAACRANGEAVFSGFTAKWQSASKRNKMKLSRTK